MPVFSRTSRQRLSTCNIELRDVFQRVIETMDCTIVCGYRCQAAQDAYFVAGKSRVKYPQGKHNILPSRAVDVCPYVGGKASFDSRHCLFFAGYVLAIAEQMGVKIRWGGDWDRDGEVMTDQKFQDLVHFELVEGDA